MSLAEKPGQRVRWAPNSKPRTVEHFDNLFSRGNQGAVMLYVG